MISVNYENDKGEFGGATGESLEAIRDALAEDGYDGPKRPAYRENGELAGWVNATDYKSA